VIAAPPIVVNIEKFRRIGSLGPIRPEQNPCPCGNLAMFCFPGLHVIGCEKKIRIFLGLGHSIDDACRPAKEVGRNRIGTMVCVVLARNPVNWSVEMGTRMFATSDGAPIPRRATIVIPRQFGNREWWRCRELRRKLNDGRIGRQRLCEVHDFHVPACQVRYQIRQGICLCRHVLAPVG